MVAVSGPFRTTPVCHIWRKLICAICPYIFLCAGMCSQGDRPASPFWGVPPARIAVLRGQMGPTSSEQPRGVALCPRRATDVRRAPVWCNANAPDVETRGAAVWCSGERGRYMDGREAGDAGGRAAIPENGR